MKSLILYKILAGMLASCLWMSLLPVTAQTTQSLPGGTLQLKGTLPALRETGWMEESMEWLVPVRKHEDEARQADQITPNALEDETDGFAQKTQAITATSIELLDSWEGLRSKYLRSDNNIAVGPNHVVQMINSALYSSYIRVWDKSGTLLINKAEMYTLVGEPDYGDPNIIYDEEADRWVISFLHSDNEAKLIIMASQTGDPTAGWWYFEFETTGGYPDYEKLARWGDSYIITTAQANPNVYALNREAILTGAGISEVIRFPIPKLKNIGWQAVSPVHQTGSLPMPADEPAVVWRVVDNWWHPPYTAQDQLELFTLSIDWADPLSSFMTGPQALPIATYNSNLCGINANTCLEQPGTTVRLWPLSNFITDKSKYMHFGDHQSIVGVHVCRSNDAGTAGQRWYELRKYPGAGWSLFQEGTYAPTADHRFIGSISINDQGTIALGYNITSSTVFPGIRMTARNACDPTGSMTAPEVIGISGTASNKSLDYGDYNSLVTDPADGSFWISAQYNVSNKWSTRVIHFAVNSCGDERTTPANDAPALSVMPNPASGTVNIEFQHFQTDDEIRMLVYNSLGALVYQHILDRGSAGSPMTIDVNAWTPGWYTLVAEQGNYRYTQRLEVIH